MEFVFMLYRESPRVIHNRFLGPTPVAPGKSRHLHVSETLPNVLKLSTHRELLLYRIVNRTAQLIDASFIKNLHCLRKCSMFAE